MVPLLVLALSLSLLAACSSQPSQGGKVACPSTITIQNFAFSPQGCTVSVGTALTFTNQDDTSHTATADAGAPVAFDTGVLAPGQTSAPITFSKAGTYSYHCNIHPSMHGTITVSAKP